jgi:NADH:ubiquinone oxidoreductase subunit 3 (subunit A)
MVEYLPILLYICVSALLSGIILSLSYFVAIQKPDPEKTSAYECGFDPFEDARAQFDIRFYLVAFLFIIFEFVFIFILPLANYRRNI